MNVGWIIVIKAVATETVMIKANIARVSRLKRPDPEHTLPFSSVKSQTTKYTICHGTYMIYR